MDLYPLYLISPILVLLLLLIVFGVNHYRRYRQNNELVKSIGKKMGFQVFGNLGFFDDKPVKAEGEYKGKTITVISEVHPRFPSGLGTYWVSFKVIEENPGNLCLFVSPDHELRIRERRNSLSDIKEKESILKQLSGVHDELVAGNGWYMDFDPHYSMFSTNIRDNEMIIKYLDIFLEVSEILKKARF